MSYQIQKLNTDTDTEWKILNKDTDREILNTDREWKILNTDTD